MMSLPEAINYKWSSKTCFQLSKEEMEVRGVLSAIETEEKNQNSTFSLRP